MDLSMAPGARAQEPRRVQAVHEYGRPAAVAVPDGGGHLAAGGSGHASRLSLRCMQRLRCTKRCILTTVRGAQGHR
eukprot:353939-Chlamydomonas_euryale.AAC.9